MCRLLKVFLSICIFWVAPIYAIEVTPMVITFSPYDTSNIPFSVIYNQLPRDIAFDIQVYDVKFDKSGLSEPKLIPLDDSPLWVFPPSLYLKAGKSQRIQFRWLGEALPQVDKTYQVSLIEQPVSSPIVDKKSKLTILLNVNLIVHVDQLSLTPHLIVEQPHLEKGMLIAKVVNTGSGASRLSDYNIEITENGVKKLKYYKDQLKSQGYDVFFLLKVPCLLSCQSLNQ